jgi:hypothetical protein
MKRSILPLAASLALAACGADTARNIGLTRDAPDEFRVTTRAPLSMPPSLGALPTPRPGAPRPQEVSNARQAEALLTPGAAAPAGGGAPTSGEQALLAATGQSAPQDIRNRVDEESLRLDRTSRTVVDRVLFWREQPEPGIPVDPEREARRLRENAALGREVSDGVTPVIQPPRPASLIDRLRFW